MNRHLPFAVAFFLTAAVAVLAIDAPAPAKPLAGKVVAIADGDTITVLVDKTQHKVRLNGIDAPESGQPFGTKAKEALAEKVFGKEVRVEWKERDRYGRIVGNVYVGDVLVNRELVEAGLAWHYKQYSKDAELAKAEVAAREGKKGLWADAKPVPPWDWRRGGRGEELGLAKDPLPKDSPVTVYVTETGKKYHLGTCRPLAKSKIPIELDEARKRYEPCGVCGPLR